MWPAELRSLVIQPCDAGSNGIRGETASTWLNSPTKPGEMQHHRGLPLAGVTHLILHERWIELFRLGPQQPVGCRQQQQVVSRSVALARLEDGLPGRDDVAAVAVQEHDPTETVGDEVVDQIAEKIEVSPRRGRERAGEVHVMVRVAQPEERRPDHAIAKCAGGQANDFPSSMLSVKTGICRPCCSRAAIGTTTGRSLATAATLGQLNSCSSTAGSQLKSINGGTARKEYPV